MLLRTLWAVEQTQQPADWPYREPSAWEELHDQLPPAPELPPLRLGQWELLQRLRGAWQGRPPGATSVRRRGAGVTVTSRSLHPARPAGAGGPRAGVHHRAGGRAVAGAAADSRGRPRSSARWRAYHWMHAVGNAAVVTAALLWGEGGFERTVALAVQAGWDTDCNGATVGSVLGAMHGVAGLPAHLVDRLGDRIRGTVLDTGGTPAASLAERTAALPLGER